MQELKKQMINSLHVYKLKTGLKLGVCQQMESIIGVLLIAKNVSLFSHSYEVSPITRWSNQEVLHSSISHVSTWAKHAFRSDAAIMPPKSKM